MKNENFIDKMARKSEASTHLLCRSLELKYPLSEMFESIEELVVQVSLRMTLAEYCLKEGKSMKDYLAFQKEFGII